MLYFRFLVLGAVLILAPELVDSGNDKLKEIFNKGTTKGTMVRKVQEGTQELTFFGGRKMQCESPQLGYMIQGIKMWATGGVQIINEGRGCLHERKFTFVAEIKGLSRGTTKKVTLSNAIWAGDADAANVNTKWQYSCTNLQN